MLTAKRLRGTPILDVQAGRRLGTADTVVFSPEQRKVLGFVMNDGGPFTTRQLIVDVDRVRAIGPDAITVDGDGAVQPLEDAAPEFREALESGRRLFGTKIMTQSGEALGSVEDLFLDGPSARVSAIALKSGITSSTDVIPIERLVSVGPDAVVVSDPGA